MELDRVGDTTMSARGAMPTTFPRLGFLRDDPTRRAASNTATTAAEEVIRDWQDATLKQSGKTYAIIGSSAADVYRAIAANNPKWKSTKIEAGLRDHRRCDARGE